MICQVREWKWVNFPKIITLSANEFHGWDIVRRLVQHKAKGRVYYMAQGSYIIWLTRLRVYIWLMVGFIIQLWLRWHHITQGTPICSGYIYTRDHNIAETYIWGIHHIIARSVSYIHLFIRWKHVDNLCNDYNNYNDIMITKRSLVNNSKSATRRPLALALWPYAYI